MKLDSETLNNRTVGGVLVGDPLSFSDTSLKLIETELQYISCVRIPAVNDLFLMGAERAQAVRLIIVDDTKMDDLTKVLDKLRTEFARANIALAYRNPRIARTLLQGMSTNPSWGLIGFLPMERNIDCWLSVIRLLASGENYVPVELINGEPSRAGVQRQDTTVVPRVQNPDVGQDIHLTKRELQVLKSAADGKQNKIIADELKLSEHTVKLHMHHIIAKLGVHNRTEAANWFHSRKVGT